jgi:Methyltransferase FkbM domain
VRITTRAPAWGNLIAEDGEGIEVPAFTVDQIMEHCGISYIDLHKVDIEGGEKGLFANGHFIRVGLVIVELHNDYQLNDFAADVANWGCRAIAPTDRGEGKTIIASPLGKRAGLGASKSS